MKKVFKILLLMLPLVVSRLPDGGLYAQKQGKALIDSLLQELPKAKEDTNKVKLLISLSFANCLINPDEGIKYGMQAVDMTNKLGWRKSLSASYGDIASNYSFKNDYTNALEYYSKALKIYEERGDKDGRATCIMNIGIIYLRQSNYPQALEYFIQALAIKEKNHDKIGMAEVFSNIGNVYWYQKNYPKALENYLKATALFEELGNKLNVANVSGNIGAVYFSENNFSEALEYFHKALKTHEELGNKNGMATVTGDIASIYLAQKDYPKALEYSFKGMKISQEIGDKTEMITNMENIGATYLSIAKNTGKTINPGEWIPAGKNANLQKGIEYLDKAITLCKEVNDSNNLMVGLTNITDAYSLSGDYKKALDSYQESIAIKDSVFNIANTRKIDQLQNDFDKKAAEEKAANEKRIAVAAEKNKQRLWIITGIAIFLVSFTGFYFYRKRENDQFKLKITEVKQEALNAQMSDHFISNVMDSINSFIENNDKEKASEYLLMFNKLIRKVLENSSKKIIQLKDELEISGIYIELEKLRFEEGALTYEIHVDKGIDEENTLIPPMIFQVLIENALKHGLKKTTGGKLKLHVSKNGNNIACAVEDNGMGRAASAYKNAKNNDRVSHGGSLAEQLIQTSSRSGRDTSYKIVDLQDEDKSPAGTRVEFSLPYILN